ncbi:Rv3235 family protein [Nonomuraea sp. NPDC050404]|uniref:Rv3235 family protein n=1 Tax=Nonomuraea sp. NPDC050404 TaxID=3155783 RepID=UPI0033DF56DB
MAPVTRLNVVPVPEEPTGPQTHGALALAPHPLVWGPPGALPNERTLRHLAQALAEVLTGRRPPESVADRLSDRAYRELAKAGQMIHASRPPFVRSVHRKEPRDGAIEMCALVVCGDRNHVLAVRLERRGLQWVCTDFETA